MVVREISGIRRIATLTHGRRYRPSYGEADPERTLALPKTGLENLQEAVIANGPSNRKESESSLDPIPLCIGNDRRVNDFCGSNVGVSRFGFALAQPNYSPSI